MDPLTFGDLLIPQRVRRHKETAFGVHYAVLCIEAKYRHTAACGFAVTCWNRLGSQPDVMLDGREPMIFRHWRRKAESARFVIGQHTGDALNVSCVEYL